jgi:hypothetical protein
VRAELQGFKPIDQSGVQVRLGQTVEIPLTMQVGALLETIQVTATPPTVDTTSTTIGANLDSGTLSRLPVGRRFSDTLYLAPGVSSGGSVGIANPSVEGSSGLENQYVVDGVNITNGGYGALGSYSIVFGSLGNGTPYDFMQEVQVKTGGYEAEFGQATGGVINVVTKSGSNDVRGSAFAYARPSSFESSYDTVQSVEGTVNTVASRLSDAGATVGGPVLRNRLFFFGAIDPQWQTNTFNAPKGFPLEGLGGVDRDRRLTNYAAKGTWQATSAHRFDGSFFGDPAKGEMGAQRTSSLLKDSTSGYSSLDYGGHNQTGHYDGILSSHFLVDASFGRAVNHILETPAVNDWLVTDFRTTPRSISGGLGFYEAGNRSSNWQIQAKATNILAGYGQHQIRYGFDFEHLDYSQLTQYSGPTFTAPNGQQTATGATVDIIPDPVFSQIYHVSRASLTEVRETTQKYSAFFVEDEWKIGSSLTIRPGVRYEQETLSGSLIQGFQLKNNWAPRVGVVWDPTRSGRSKVFANYGRYYARVPNDLAARALSSDASLTADYFDANLTKPVPNGTLTTNAVTGASTTNHFTLLGAAADDIDPNAKLSNYAVTVNNGTLTVNPAPLVVTAANASRLYGDPNPAFTGTILGLKNGDNITATYSSAADPTSAVGDYPIVPALVDPSSRLGNYVVTSNNGTLSVNPAPLSVIADDATRAVNTPNPVFTGTITGIKNGDNITATYDSQAQQTDPAGTYPIIPTLLDPTAKLGNYTVTATNGTLTVTP